MFGRPYVACHLAIMRRFEQLFQRSTLPSSMTHYPAWRANRLPDSGFLTANFPNRPALERDDLSRIDIALSTADVRARFQLE
jgi:hypothetical protein